ncbi:MAG: hypothetical protein DWQ49_09960 [Bacteroidetes bacterium]|nr:MAG: hypothetical protein DWQ49_09960 [Bacteroidota bacterium]
MNNLEDTEKETYRLSQAFKRVFNSSDGKVVLEELNKEFGYPQLAGPDPHLTVVRAAQFDVLKYIDLLINYKGETHES